MARTIDTATIQLIVNGSQAEQELSKINAQLITARKNQQAAYQAGDTKSLKQYTREVTRLEAEQRKMQSRAQAIRSALERLDKATPKELRATIKEINAQLSSGAVARGSKEWDTLTEALRRAKGELQAIKEEQKAETETEQGGGIAEWGRKWVGAFTIVKGVADGIGDLYANLKDAMEGYVNEYALLAEHMADVTKYTGLGKDDVNALNEAFKQMDTRTPRAALNDLAADAGRLGIQAKDQVLEFVEAADQINVALGEDLGDDAVKEIGKLAQMFGDADKMGLKQAMLATGSVINELAQSSSAAEGYILEFTQRLAGVGKQAGLSQAQIMGLASVLDQSSVGAEVGATALSRILQLLYQNPAKMAQAAGLEVQQFTDLLKTDANAALLAFAKGMNNLGGMEGMAPVLKELSLTGSGVAQTLMTIAQNTDTVTATQEQAKQAFSEATSVTNEAATANATLQARLEKAQQQAADLRAELGEKLYPVYLALITGSNTLGQALLSVIGFITKHRLALAATTATITALSVRLALATLGQKAWNVAVATGRSISLIATTAVGLLRVAYTLFAHGVAAAKIQMQALNLAIKSNPIGLVISAITALVAFIWTWIAATDDETEALEKQEKQLSRTEEAQRDLAEARKTATEDTMKERMQIQQLSATLHDNSKSYDERRAALDSLRAIVPSYHATLTREGQLLNDNTEAIDEYIKELDRMALAKALFDKLVASVSKEADYSLALKAYQNGTRRREQMMQSYRQTLLSPDEGGDATTLSTSTREKMQAAHGLTVTANILRNNKRREDALKAQIASEKQYQKSLYDFAKEQGATSQLEKLIAAGGSDTSTPVTTTAHSSGTGSGGSTGSSGSTGSTPTPDERIKAQGEQEKAQQELLYRSGLTSYEEYLDHLYTIQLNSITRRQALHKKGSSEWNDLELERYQLIEDTAKKHAAYSLEQIEIDERTEQDSMRQAYAQGELSEEEYQQALTDIKLKYLKARADLQRTWGSDDDAAKAESEFQKAQQEEQLRRQKEFARQLAEIRDNYLPQHPHIEQEAQLTTLDSLRSQGLLKEEEYQDARLAIIEKYRDRIAAETERDGELQGLADKYQQGLLKEEEYQAARLAIIEKYRDRISGGTTTTHSEGGEAATAGSPLKSGYQGTGSIDTSGLDSATASVGNLINSLLTLSQQLKSGQASWTSWTSVAVNALSAVSALASQGTQLVQANQKLAEAAVTERYDKEIEAAGESTAKGKQLSEKKEKELAKVKNKYNRRAMRIELAAALADTAKGALLAYVATLAGLPYPVNMILAPIMAAQALAAGMIQVAVIKKQHAAQAAGYYEGGFTANIDPRKVAGLVHGGEFVVNARAVKSPTLTPLLTLIDHAQRTNTIPSLTPERVSQSLAAPALTARHTLRSAHATTSLAESTATAAQREATSQALTTATLARQADTAERTTQALERLNDQLDTGIQSYVILDGQQGLAHQYERYNLLRGKKN